MDYAIISVWYHELQLLMHIISFFIKSKVSYALEFIYIKNYIKNSGFLSVFILSNLANITNEK